MQLHTEFFPHKEITMDPYILDIKSLDTSHTILDIKQTSLSHIHVVLFHLQIHVHYKKIGVNLVIMKSTF